MCTLEFQGNQAYKEKQWEKAIGCYTEAIKLNSRNATYYSNRAAAYLELGRYIHFFHLFFVSIFRLISKPFPIGL